MYIRVCSGILCVEDRHRLNVQNYRNMHKFIIFILYFIKKHPEVILLVVYHHCPVVFNTVIPEAFRLNKAPLIFNQGAAVWLSALETVVRHQFIWQLIYVPLPLYKNILALRLFQLFTVWPLVPTWTFTETVLLDGL